MRDYKRHTCTRDIPSIQDPDLELYYVYNDLIRIHNITNWMLIACSQVKLVLLLSMQIVSTHHWTQLQSLIASSGLRIEWFKSRERFKRWEEEVFWLQREATSVILSFHAQGSCWLAKAHETPGQDWQAYCKRQHSVWNKLATHAYTQFSPILKVCAPLIFWFCTAHLM
jgi:hypothetical protein